MKQYRISKYDPSLRDKNGRFPVETWTSVFDIGKSFNGEVLSKEVYLEAEDAYVKAIKSLFEEVGSPSLNCVEIECHDPSEGVLKDEFEDDLAFLDELPGEISSSSLEKISRLALRELIWIKLEANQKFYVHFGYDYYVYVGGVSLKTIDLAEEDFEGVYVENFVSPYN